jgi:hypothetical protein
MLPLNKESQSLGIYFIWPQRRRQKGKKTKKHSALSGLKRALWPWRRCPGWAQLGKASAIRAKK